MYGEKTTGPMTFSELADSATVNHQIEAAHSVTTTVPDAFGSAGQLTSCKELEDEEDDEVVE